MKGPPLDPRSRGAEGGPGTRVCRRLCGCPSWSLGESPRRRRLVRRAPSRPPDACPRARAPPGLGWSAPSAAESYSPPGSPAGTLWFTCFLEVPPAGGCWQSPPPLSAQVPGGLLRRPRLSQRPACRAALASNGGDWGANSPAPFAPVG